MATITAPERAQSIPPPGANAPADSTARRDSRSWLRRRVRPVLFWLHLTAGSALGLVILTQALSGITIAYRRQVVEGIVRQQLASTSNAGRGATAPPRLSLDTLAARAAAATGQHVEGVTLRREADAPLVVQLEGRRTAYMNPATGAVLPGAPRLEAFFAYMEGVHRWLAVTGRRSPLGEGATAASVLAFGFLLLTGLTLWIPARWTRRAVGAVALPERAARGRARDWNLHHVAGLWASPILLVMITAGVFMAWDWPGRLLARATGSAAPTPDGPPPGGRRPGRGRAPSGPTRDGAPNDRPNDGPNAAPRASLDTLAARALAAVPGPWYAVQLRLSGGPPNGPGPRGVQAVVAGSADLRPDLRTQVTLDPATGAVRSRQGYDGQDRARRIRSWMHPIHSGEWAGVPGETVSVLGALAAATLVWTGFALALRRARRTLARRS